MVVAGSNRWGWVQDVKDYEAVMDGEMKFSGKDTFSQIGWESAASSLHFIYHNI